MTKKFTCAICGKAHDISEMTLAYKRPYHYLSVPETEREKRIKANDDVCVIDNEQFFLRGVLELPIKGTDDQFEWGTWALVNQQNFRRYLELWDANVDNEPPFKGWLSGSLRDYPDSHLLEVSVQLRSNGKRPLFNVISQQHPLGIDQRDGITLERVHDFIGDR